MKIGLSAWIIQDGNYGDFAIGDELRFALEFYASTHSIIQEAPVSAVYIKDAIYSVIAKVIFKKDGLTIIDFGYMAFSEQILDAKIGDWLEAEIYIGIDPFMYFEGWARKEGIPEISYTWRINEIRLETTPCIEEKPNYFVRDKSQFTEYRIQQTDAWNDDEGHAEYTLDCETL